MKIFDLNFDVEEDPIPDGEEHDLLENVMDGEDVHDSPREKVKTEKEYLCCQFLEKKDIKN